jgi:signal transduction histidine kinase
VALFFLLIVVLFFLLNALTYALFARHDGRFIPLPAVFFGVLLLFLLLGLLRRLFRRTAAPIAEVMEAAERLAGGDYSVRVDPRGAPDVRQLGLSFNAMAARLEESEQRRRALLADVAHELRTPLSVVRGNVEGLLDGLYPRDDEHLQPILEETQHMVRLLEDLRTLSMAEAGVLALEREPTSLRALIEETVEAFKQRAAAGGVDLAVRAAEAPVAEVDPFRLREVLENLLSNALRFTPAGGRVEVESRSVRDGETLISVTDSGVGIPAEQMGHVFDRYVKLADSGGSGLGLAIARRLVEAHRGSISVEVPEGGGTRFVIRLPA